MRFKSHYKYNTAHLRSHYKLMVHNKVGSEAHSKEGWCWMKVTWHSCPTVHILSNTFQSGSLMKVCCNIGGNMNYMKCVHLRENFYFIQPSAVAPQVRTAAGCYGLSMTEWSIISALSPVCLKQHVLARLPISINTSFLAAFWTLWHLESKWRFYNSTTFFHPSQRSGQGSLYHLQTVVDLHCNVSLTLFVY